MRLATQDGSKRTKRKEDVCVLCITLASLSILSSYTAFSLLPFRQTDRQMNGRMDKQTDRRASGRADIITKTGSTNRSARIMETSLSSCSHLRLTPEDHITDGVPPPRDHISLKIRDNREPKVPSTRQRETSFPSSCPYISHDFVMASQEAVIIRHCTASLYLQQDHQQLLIVPGGVAADILLQLAAELWWERQGGGVRMTLMGSF